MTSARPDLRPEPHGRRLPAGLAGLGALLAAALLPACQPAFERYRTDLRAEIAAGRTDRIEAALDAPDNELRDRDADRLLWLLDRGTVAVVRNEPDTALAILNEAERRMDARRKQPVLETLAAVTISDQLTTYRGEPYEDLYVNVLKMLAQLEAGRLRGGATVEARRLATKVDLLRDEYLKAERRAGAPPGTAQAGRFVESTLGTYLTAVTYMHTGERANQAVAARRLAEAIAAQPHIVGPVAPEPFARLGTTAPQEANVLLVGLSGQGPYKVPFPVGPVFVDGTPVYFELPVLERVPSRVAGVRAVIDGPGPRGGARRADLHFIEDLGSVADENHRRQLPLTYARTALRATGKSLALHELNRQLADRSGHPYGHPHHLAYAGAYRGHGRHHRHGHHAAPPAIPPGLALLALTATEQADLRAWTLLPGQAHVGLLRAAPGRHRVRLEFLDAHGRVVHRGPPREVVVGATGLATVVEGCWE